MIARCENANTRHYARYGGRGIRVCDRWRESFAYFLQDVGERPSPAHTLDRIDNSSDYAPGNVRWVLPKEQARNRRNNRMIHLGGVSMTLAEACESRGLDRRTVGSRLKRGWTIDRAFSP